MPYDMKRHPRPETLSAEAARVGEDLRDSRQALGISLDDMSEQLRINRRYLAALEEGRVRDLPGVAYATGFVRSYAQMLGLDANEMVRRFREGAGLAARPKDLVFPEPVPDRGVPAGAIVMVGAVLAVAGYAGWYYWSGSSGRAVDDVPALPPRLEQSAREAGSPPLPAGPLAPGTLAPGTLAPGTLAPGTLLPGGAPPNAATPGGPAAPATPVPGAVTPLLPGPLRPGQPVPAAPSATSPATSPATPPAASLPGGAAPGAGTPTAGAPAAGAAPPAPANRVLLRATQEVWVQVRDPRGNRVVLNRVLRPGETFEVPEGGGFVLNTGKAEGLVLEVDGRPSAAFTGVSGVRNGVLLDAGRLRDAAAGQLPTR